MKTQKNYLKDSGNRRKTRKLMSKKTRKGGAKPNQGTKYQKLGNVGLYPTGKTQKIGKKSLFTKQEFEKANTLMRTIHRSSKQRNLDKKEPEDSTDMQDLFAEATKNPFAFYAAAINKHNSLNQVQREAFAKEAIRFQMNPTISGTMVHKSVPKSKRCTYGKICIRKNPEHKLLAHPLPNNFEKSKKFSNPASFLHSLFSK